MREEPRMHGRPPAARLEELTLVTASFNTPEVTMTMLRSFVHHHGRGPHHVLIMENSTDARTRSELEREAIPYIENPDGRHAPSVDRALRLVATRYALLVDTDIVFQRSILRPLDVFHAYELALMGEVCGDRGGYKLHPRVHPWFCFIDVEAVREHRIGFHDEARVRETGSIGFFDRVPINERPPEWSTRRFYDVGSTFYADIDAAGLRIGDAHMENEFFAHYEGTSWHGQSGVTELEAHHARMRDAYTREVARYRDVALGGSFVAGFAPDDLASTPSGAIR